MKSSIDTITIVLWTFIFLSQPLLDSSIFISNNESAIVGMAIWMHEKSNQTAMLLMKGYEPIEIYIEHSISIQQQKIRIQMACLSQEKYRCHPQVHNDVSQV